VGSAKRKEAAGPVGPAVAWPRRGLDRRRVAPPSPAPVPAAGRRRPHYRRERERESGGGGHRCPAGEWKLAVELRRVCIMPRAAAAAAAAAAADSGTKRERPTQQPWPVGRHDKRTWQSGGGAWLPPPGHDRCCAGGAPRTGGHPPRWRRQRRRRAAAGGSLTTTGAVEGLPPSGWAARRPRGQPAINTQDRLQEEYNSRHNQGSRRGRNATIVGDGEGGTE